MKKTFKELRELDAMVASVYEDYPDLKKGKFGYAYKRYAEKSFFPIYKEYVQALLDIRVEHALVDEKTKALLTADTSRGYLYSKDGMKAVMAAERELNISWETKEFEVFPHILNPNDVPADLTDGQKADLAGIVI